MNRVACTAAVLALLVCAAPIHAQEPLLVGLIVNRQEVATVEALRSHGQYFIPLRPFVEFSRCAIDSTSGRYRVGTPLGDVVLSRRDLRTRDGVLYIGQATLEERFRTTSFFDVAEYALELQVPWSIAEPELTDGGIPLVPETGPASATLSSFRQDFVVNRSRDVNTFTSQTALGGALERGYWRLRLSNGLAGKPRVRDFSWYRAFERTMFQFGQQQIALHPLLRNFDVTGVQVAWTNQPLERFPYAFGNDGLLPRRIDPTTTLDGAAPPGSVVQLRIDGRVRAQQVVGWDGHYRFDDVKLPARQLANAEVIVVDPNRPTAPIEIRERRIHTSEYLLPKGAIVHMGGVGSYGNLADQLMSVDSRRGVAGFYRYRQGLYRRLTAEATVQTVGGEASVQAGFVSRLGSAIVTSIGVGAANDRPSYAIDLEGRWPLARLLAHSTVRPAGYLVDGVARAENHDAELWFTPSHRVELGAVARYRLITGQLDDFVLPGFIWRPHRALSLSARPNFEGDYRLQLAARLSARDQLRVTSENRTYSELSHRFARPYRLALGAALGGGLPDRYSLALGSYSYGRFRPSWNVGAFFERGEPGLLVNAGIEMLPGILGHIRYQSIPAPELAFSESSLSFQISADFTLAGSRLMPANTLTMRPDRGAVAGRVVIDGAGGLRAFNLGDLQILVDGGVAARTNRNGYFFVGNLKDGIYRLELELENLPIELVPTRRVIVAEVAGGATTRVDFVVAVQCGFAGRVTDPDGRAWPGVRVEVLDADGQRVRVVRTDRFGLYRVDGLPVGRYTCRVAADSLPGVAPRPPARVVDVVDGFLFEQDLVIPWAAPGLEPVAPGDTEL